MKNYELLYILPAGMTGKEIKENFEEVVKNIKTLKGEMLKTLVDHPFLVKSEISKEEESEELKNLPITKRKLAYPVKKNRFGFYCLVNFSIDPDKIKEVDQYLRMNNNLLRHIITQDDPMTKKMLEQLQKLFARKRAEQEKEKVELEKEAKNEEKKIKKEREDKLKKTMSVEKVKTEEKEDKKKDKSELKKTKKEEEKKTTDKKKKKIKLEELEDKLDEILEDTII